MALYSGVRNGVSRRGTNHHKYLACASIPPNVRGTALKLSPFVGAVRVTELVCILLGAKHSLVNAQRGCTHRGELLPQL